MRNKRTVRIGDRVIGGNEPVLIQSMTNTDTADVDATVSQILSLEEAGCEIIRVAAYDVRSACAIEGIKERIHIPLVADVHFDADIAIAAIEHGADKVRINPGNIGSEANVRRVADAAKMHHVPIRVGANSGSLDSKYQGMDMADALYESAVENIRMLENAGFHDIVVALKSSDVRESIRAYRKMDASFDYPLHVGVTEAGDFEQSIVKSSIGIGGLLADDIGDTIRVSVTGDPILEIKAAKDILRFSGVRSFGPEIISCPTCARTEIDLIGLTGKVKELVKDIDRDIRIAVMGCIVNGPGEARNADIGIAGGKGEGLIFKKGIPVIKVREEELFDTFREYLKEYLSE